MRGHRDEAVGGPSAPAIQGRCGCDRSPTVWALGVSIVTDEGAWRGIPAIHYGPYGAGEHVLVGEGAYDGLTAIAKVDLDGQTWSWEGWIIGDDLPPVPAEPEAIPQARNEPVRCLEVLGGWATDYATSDTRLTMLAPPPSTTVADIWNL